MIRRMARTPRSGFTLIELLMVVVIILLLAALLLPAIAKVRSFANRSTVNSELNMLAASAQKFQSDFGFYPPHAVRVVDPVTGTPQLVAFRIPATFPPQIPTNFNQAYDAACLGYYRKVYPRWGAGLYTGATGLAGAGAVLDGNQSMVYFLGGPSGTGWATDAPIAPTGTVSKGPYYNFPLTSESRFKIEANGMPRYYDSYGSPYAYFGSGVEGKYLDFTAFPVASPWNGTNPKPYIDGTRFVNEKGCQIISAGENGADDSLPVARRGFGAGGIWIPGQIEYTLIASGGDDLGNFNAGAPLSRRGE